MRFVMLGALSAHRHDEPISLGRPLHQTVLALLLVHANEQVSTEQIIDAIWDGCAPNTARGQIHNAMSGLRQALGSPEQLMSRDRGYLLALSPDELDATVFEQLLGEAKKAAPEEAVKLYRGALDLWTGEPLTGIRAGFADRARLQLRERWLTAWEQLAAHELSLERHRAITPELTALVAAYPLHERLVERLMLALFRGGRPTDALAAARSYRQRLTEEQGLDPGQSFTDLELAILRQDDPLRRVDPEPPTHVPAQLPPDMLDFTGRVDELKLLSELAQDRNVGIITGTGGSGKTSLSVRWAHDNATRFPDGQLYINLHGYSSSTSIGPEVALPRFLRSLGMPAERIPSDVDEAAAAFRTLLAQRRMLVVLDNAADADQVRPLLPGGDSLALINSRDSLRGIIAKEGAFQIDLAELSASESEELMERAIGLERVRADLAGFAQIAVRCGHLPLAMRIAAAQMVAQPQLSTSAYLADFDEAGPLSTLTIDGDGDACVHTTFELSHRRLSPPEQHLFKLLSLIPGPDFTVPVAAAMLAVPQPVARRLMDRLAGAHLIQRRDPGRFQFHDLLHWYAKELPLPPKAEEATNRLFRHYLNSADAAGRRLYPSSTRLIGPLSATSFPDNDAALAWLEAERANVIAAIMVARSPLAWQMAETIRQFVRMFPDPIDWSVDWPSAALASADDLAGRISAHFTCGQRHLFGNPAKALEHYRIAAGLAESQPRSPLAAALTNSLGLAHDLLGQIRLAADCFSHGAQLARQREDHFQYTMMNCNLGLALHFLGDYERGWQCLHEGLDLYREADNLTGEADAHCMMGVAHLDEGRPELALAEANAALEILDRIGVRLYQSDALNVLGSALMALGRGGALDAFEKALHLALTTSNHLGSLNARLGLAELHSRLGQTGVALSYGQSALDQARARGYRIHEADALAILSRLTGNREFAKQALEIQLETEYVAGQNRARHVLSSL